jgi:hypothetical protein
MLNKFSGDDQAMQFRMVHQDLIAYADPTVLVIGINPTVRASHPLDANTPSGELVHRWIRGVPRDVRVMLLNIVPGLWNVADVCAQMRKFTKLLQKCWVVGAFSAMALRSMWKSPGLLWPFAELPARELPYPMLLR